MKSSLTPIITLFTPSYKLTGETNPFYDGHKVGPNLAIPTSKAQKRIPQEEEEHSMEVNGGWYHFTRGSQPVRTDSVWPQERTRPLWDRRDPGSALPTLPWQSAACVPGGRADVSHCASPAGTPDLPQNARHIKPMHPTSVHGVEDMIRLGASMKPASCATCSLIPRPSHLRESCPTSQPPRPPSVPLHL